MAKDEEYELAFVSGVEGPHISLNNFRLAGPKAWGGGRVLHSWMISLTDLLRAIPALHTDDEVRKLKECIRDMIPYVRNTPVETCGLCGTPNAQCDMMCVDAAMQSELLLNAIHYTKDLT